MRASYLTELKKNKRLLCCEKVTLTYNGNNNTSGTAPVDSLSPYNSGSLVTILGNLGNLAKTNYTFSGWNTAANGSGISYLPNNTFIINKNTILYAMWTPSYRIFYDGNTNTYGDPPVDNNIYNGFTPAIILGRNTLEKYQYAFSAWNTAANGSGTSYSPGDTITINATITLYAMWIPSYEFRLYYDGNGETDGYPPDDTNVYNGLTPAIILGENTLVKDGYTFVRWNTQFNDLGIPLDPGDTYYINADTTLYAIWTPLFTLTYDGNGGTGTAPIDVDSPYPSGSLVSVLDNNGIPPLTNPDYAFNSWNTDTGGTGTTYFFGVTFNINADTTLYAKWEPTYELTYDGNTNTSGTAPVDINSPYMNNSLVSVLDNVDLEKIFHTFIGWNTQPDGSGTPYEYEDTFNISADTTLYAQWQLI
jgi:uncharacterized repeat protein (TIGR02543 family)